PYGWRMYEAVAVMAGQPAIAPWVVEFQPTSFQGMLGAIFAAYVIVAIGAIALSRDRLTLFELGTFVGSLALGLVMTRNMALFAILAAPTVARRLEELWPGAEARAPVPAPLLAIHWALLVGALAVAAASFPLSSRWQDHVEPGSVPIDAVDYVAKNHRGERIFNDFNWGGFLIYRLYPDVRVSMDGRTPVYGEEILRKYARTHYVQGDWKEFLEECAPEVVLWPAGGALAAVLRRLPQWRVVYEDETAVVFADQRRMEKRSL
ncbi:MAG: hypothetical protein ACREQ9_09795, partial [Candidatus Binatia bacterium]